GVLGDRLWGIRPLAGLSDPLTTKLRPDRTHARHGVLSVGQNRPHVAQRLPQRLASAGALPIAQLSGIQRPCERLSDHPSLNPHRLDVPLTEPSSDRLRRRLDHVGALRAALLGPLAPLLAV